MNLNELLITAGGIGIVVKLVLDVVKSIWSVSGRGTQALAIVLGVALGVFGGLRYLPGSDIAQSVWLGLQAGAAAIGIDQIAKRDV